MGRKERWKKEGQEGRKDRGAAAVAVKEGRKEVKEGKEGKGPSVDRPTSPCLSVCLPAYQSGTSPWKHASSVVSETRSG